MRGVQNSSDLQRILKLPVRLLPDEHETESLRHRVTQAFRVPGGEMVLRATQAIALLEIARARGGYFPIVVGGGKTLISLLSPVALEAKRPLLLVPASLRDKTRAEIPHLRTQFRIAENIKIMSYETLSGASHADDLMAYDPDAIICDESHYLKNASSAVKKRVSRFMRARPHTSFVAMTGTAMTRSVREEAHIVAWALKRNSPMPLDWSTLDEWSCALDARVQPGRRMLPGALSMLGEGDAHEGVQRRFFSTLGILKSLEPEVDVELAIKARYIDSPIAEAHWERLRDEAVTPDGWECADGIEVWRHARELGLGGYYKWDPRPPREWLLARSAWAKASREIIAHNQRGLDTEAQVRQAVRDGLYPKHESALALWDSHRDTFEPNVVAEWISTHLVDEVREDAKVNVPTIYWTSHRLFGAMLAKETGMRYFAQNAIDSTGLAIRDCRESCIASVASCGTGQNLQHYSRNVFLGSLVNNGQYEQTIGRTHRPGQMKKVECEIWITCIEDEQAIWKSLDEATNLFRLRGERQRIARCEVEGLETFNRAHLHAQWRK